MNIINQLGCQYSEGLHKSIGMSICQLYRDVSTNFQRMLPRIFFIGIYQLLSDKWYLPRAKLWLKLDCRKIVGNTHYWLTTDEYYRRSVSFILVVSFQVRRCRKTWFLVACFVFCNSINSFREIERCKGW